MNHAETVERPLSMPEVSALLFGAPPTLSREALEAAIWLAMRARKNGLVAVAPRDRDPELLRGIDELVAVGLLDIPLDVIRSEGDLVLSLAPMMRRAG